MRKLVRRFQSERRHYHCGRQVNYILPATWEFPGSQSGQLLLTSRAWRGQLLVHKERFIHFLITLLSNIRFWSFARLTLPLKFTFHLCLSQTHIFTNSATRQTSLMNDWFHFFFPEGGDGRRPPFTVRLFITCQQDSCSLGQQSSVEWLCKDSAPDSSSSTGILKKHQHHQGQVLSCFGKDSHQKATVLSLCPTHCFLETSQFPFSSLTTRWNILPLCIEALNRLQTEDTAWEPSCWEENSLPMMLL